MTLVTMQVTCCLHSGTGSGRRRGRRLCWLSAACRGWWCRAPPGTRSGPRWTCRPPPRGWGNRGNCWCLRRYHVFLLFLFGTRKENLLIEFYNVWKEKINVWYTVVIYICSTQNTYLGLSFGPFVPVVADSPVSKYCVDRPASRYDTLKSMVLLLIRSLPSSSVRGRCVETIKSGLLFL